jgi:GT2 family glycosyltransferase
VSADGQAPAVAVLTVNYNGGSHIAEFLASLGGMTYSNWALVVVDNASSDGSPDEIASLFPRAELIRNGENLGITGGHNVGIRHCLEHGFDYVLFLNNDTVVEQDLLDRLVRAADDRTMVAPKTYLYGRRPLLDDTVGDFDWWRGIWRGWLYGKPEPHGFDRWQPNMASLCCLLVPASVFRDAGLMDERFFMYYDDFDFVRRAKQAGYRLRLETDAVVYHRKAASSGGVDSPFKLYYATRNRLHLMRKHLPLWRFGLFLAYFLGTRSAYLLSLAVRGRWVEWRATVRGIADYFRGRLGRTYQVADFR